MGFRCFAALSGRNRQRLNSRWILSFDEFARAGLSNEFAILDECTTAGQHHFRRAFYTDAFEHRIIHAHVVSLRADYMLRVWVKHDEVSV